MDEQQQNTIEDSQKLSISTEDYQKLFISKAYYNLITSQDYTRYERWRDYNSLEKETYKNLFKEYWEITYTTPLDINQIRVHRIKITNQIYGEHPRKPHEDICLYEKEININIEGDFNKYNEENIETIFHSFKQLKNKRLKRRFSKLLGFFAKPKMIEYHELLSKGFGGADICCVCHEETFCRTKCWHYICSVCTTKLRKKICPMCREIITKNDSDSESE